MSRMVKVRVLPEGKTLDVEAERVEDIFRKLGYSREAYVALVNGKPVLESQRISEDDEIVLVRVLSGG